MHGLKCKQLLYVIHVERNAITRDFGNMKQQRLIKQMSTRGSASTGNTSNRLDRTTCLPEGLVLENPGWLTPVVELNIFVYQRIQY